MELIDSDVAFTSRQLSIPKIATNFKYVKPKGIERQLVPNERIRKGQERGGILTMPGILAMNRAPSRNVDAASHSGRAARRASADVPPIQATPQQTSSFRDRLISIGPIQPSPRCHDRIDPLGFALQEYDDDGAYKLAANYKTQKNQRPRRT